MKYLRYLSLGSILLLCMACGEEDRCFNCALNITEVDICTDNYKEKAALNNLDVDSLDEYIGLLREAGFDCNQIQ